MKLNRKEVKMIRGRILRNAWNIYIGENSPGLNRLRFRFVGRKNGIKYFDIYEEMSRNYLKPIRRNLSQNCIKYHFFQNHGQSERIQVGEDKKGTYLYRSRIFHDCLYISRSIKSWRNSNDALKELDIDDIEFGQWEKSEKTK